MKIELTLNGQLRSFDCREDETLMALLRRSGMWSVKHGCESGECGACSVLVEGRLAATCVLLAAQMEGHRVDTVERSTAAPGRRCIDSAGLCRDEAIQCGFCTPAMVLAAQELLGKTLTPSEAEIRSALGGVLCRCTGYVKPVEAVQRAAALLRGEAVPPLDTADSLPLAGFFDALRPPQEPELPDGDVLTKPQVAFSPFRQSTPSPRPTWSATPRSNSTRSSWSKASQPLPTTSTCPACCMLPCSPAHMPTPASSASRRPAPGHCPGCMQC
jgi:putative selenate reductase molybdopterin-binding subunit